MPARGKLRGMHQLLQVQVTPNDPGNQKTDFS